MLPDNDSGQMAWQLLLKQADWSSRRSLTGWLRGLSSHERSESEEVREGSGPFKSNEEKKRMKKYVKPSLTSLGLLRVVTQLSCRPGNCEYIWDK